MPAWWCSQRHGGTHELTSAPMLSRIRGDWFGSRWQRVLWLSCGAVVALGALASRWGLVDVLGWLGLVLGLLIVLACAGADERVAAALLTAFALRALLALVDHYVMRLPDTGIDTVWYEQTGWAWAQAGLGYVLAHIQPGARLYVWMIAMLYAVAGRSPLLVQALNVLLGSLVVWVTYRTSEALWGGGNAVRAAWVIAIFPTTVLYSCITLREVATVYPFMLGTLGLVHWAKSHRFRDLLGCLLGLAVAVGFNTGILAAMAVVCVIMLLHWLSSLRSRDATAVRATIAVILVVAVVGFVLASGWGLSKFGSLSKLSLAKLARMQERLARGRTAYLQGVTPRSVVDLAWQVPLRVVHFLFAPFLWMRLVPKDALALLDSALMLGLAVTLWRSWRHIVSQPAARGVALVLLALVVAFALGVSNYGTAIRHRSKLVPLAATLLCVQAPMPLPEWPGRNRRPER